MRTAASTDRTTIPFENTRRSPRFLNCEGMNRSRARMADRRGKSWYEVFAARIRIPAVRPWSRKNGSVRPKTVSPIWESTDREAAISSFTRTCRRTDMIVMPRNIVTVMKPMAPSVVAALRDCGRRNACTPLEMASTPVRAVAPEENARRIRNRLSAPVASRWRSAVSASGQPARHRMKPVASITKIMATNP
jgi:hypothetical protein